MSKRVIAAHETVDAAREELQAAIEADYPIGKRIYCTRNSVGTPFAAEVLAHGYEDRIKIRNLTTGKEYWVTSYWISGCRS